MQCSSSSFLPLLDLLAPYLSLIVIQRPAQRSGHFCGTGKGFHVTGHSRECRRVAVKLTMDLRRRDDLVSLGVMLGRPLAL